MDSGLNTLLLPVMITCAVFVGAINSKGVGKMVFSYLLAFACLAITALYSTEYFSTYSQKRAHQIAGEATKMLEDKLEEMEKIEEPEEPEQPDENLMAVNQYKEKAGTLISKMKSLRSKLRSMDLNPNSDEEYEILLQRANGYLGEMRSLNTRVKSLKVPSDMRSTQVKLENASSVLLFGCTKMRRFFNAENMEEEIEASQTFQAKTRQAAHLLNQVESDLN